MCVIYYVASCIGNNMLLYEHWGFFIIATGLDCAAIRTSSSIPSNRTIDLVKLRRRTRNLLDTTMQNGVNNSTINMLLNITSETDSVTNTRTPLEPSDIPIILDILQDVIEYVYILTL